MTLAEDITPHDVDEIRRRIIDYNTQAVSVTGPQAQDLNIALRDAEGRLKGGIIASFHGWGILFIDLLWVDADCRSMGYGSKLLREAERLARQRGCGMVQLDTFGFQAPDFYQREGYDCFAVLENFPPGHKRYYFKKVLL